MREGLRKYLMYGSLSVLKLLNTLFLFSYFKKIKGKIFYFTPEVFCPYFFVVSSTFFVDHLIIPRNAIVLDMGTGSGILAIFASERAQKVIASDISPYATHNARINIKLNNLSNKIKVQRGNLFQNIKDKFSVILFNPPYFPLKPKTFIEVAWCCGQNYAVIKNFLAKATTYLTPSGIIQISVSSYMDLSYIKKLFNKYKFKPVVVARKFIFFETLFIYLLIPQR